MSRNWKSVSKQIANPKMHGTLLPKPTIQLFAEFKHQQQMLFPTVYREFILVLGAGDPVLTNNEGVEVVRFEF